MQRIATWTAMLAVAASIAPDRALAAGAAPDPGPGWALSEKRTVKEFVGDVGAGWVKTGTRRARYFVAGAEADEQVEKELARSELLDRTTERTAPSVGRERVDGAAITRSGRFERAGAPSARFAREGQNLVTYQDTPIETVKTTTVTVPYSIVETSTWSERERLTFRNTYSTRTQIKIPLRGSTESVTRAFEAVEGPYTEIGYKPWVAMSSRRTADVGQDVTTSEEVVDSRVLTLIAAIQALEPVDEASARSTLAKRASALAQATAPAAGGSLRDLAFSSGSVAGSGEARTSSAGAARRISRSDLARSGRKQESGIAVPKVRSERI